MKRLISLCLVLSLIIAGCCSCAPCDDEIDKTVIVASFYPVYIFTLNLVDGIEGVSVQSMAQQNVGCLHDYSLTARDVKLLQDASLFIINGAGMETFIEDIYESVDGLKTIDSSKGIELLCTHHHKEEHSAHDHSHTENSHIWLSVENAKKQIKNIRDGIIKEFPQFSEKVNENCNNYLLRLDALCEKRDEFKKSVEGKKVVSFHGAYEYLAEECGFEIIETIEADEGGEPSAKALASLSERIKDEKITALFIEPEYEGSAAEILSNETNVKIYTLNPVISGTADLTAYEDIMGENYETILKAVK